MSVFRRARSQKAGAPPPDFRSLPTGTFADYLLDRRLLDLNLAQNFEDLICLASFNGVDTYHYQQETLRRVLRHFMGRALLGQVPRLLEVLLSRLPGALQVRVAGFPPAIGRVAVKFLW
jgi:hypothetical protein